ncbi:hypothetical protein YC2023_023104 [Brassica napus]
MKHLWARTPRRLQDQCPSAPATRFLAGAGPASLGLLAGSARHLHPLLPIPADATPETRASTLRWASSGGLPYRFGPSSSDGREDSLAAAALLRASGSDPVVPLYGYRRSSQAVDLVQIFQPRMELRLQLPNSISPSLERLESHGPPCLAAPHLTGTRFQSTTSSDPNLFGDASVSPAYKVMLSSPRGSSSTVV